MRKNFSSLITCYAATIATLLIFSGCSYIKKSPKEIESKAKLSSNPILINLQKSITKNAGGRMVLEGTNKHFEVYDYRIKNTSGDTITLEYDKKTLITETSKVKLAEDIKYEIRLDELQPDDIKRTKKLYGYFCILINNEDAVKPISEDTFFKDEVIIPFNSRVHANKVESLLKKLTKVVNKENGK